MTKSRNALGIVAALLWGLLTPAVFSVPQRASSRNLAQKKQTARQIFQKAEAARAELSTKPADSRKLPEYHTLIRLYENVFHLSAVIREAPESVFRAAQLNQEAADLFAADKKAARYATEARRLCKFLIREYPEHRFVADARKLTAEMDKAEEERKAAAEAAAAAPPPSSQPAPAERKPLVQITGIRQWKTPTYTRVVIDLEDEVKFETGRISDPDRIYFDLHDSHIAPSVSRNLEGDDGLVKRVRLGLNRIGLTRVVLEVGQIATYSAFLLPNPYRMVIDIQGATEAAKAETPRLEAPRAEPAKAEPPKSEPVKTEAAKSEPPKAAAEKAAPPKVALKSAERGEETPATKGPTSKPVYEAAKRPVAPAPARDGHRSLTRALGLKIARIVIDPGHGGHDTGTIGPSGLMEKDLVLDVAQRLGALVEERLGSEVVYTRTDDTFIPLESRTASANQKRADLFISIHANSSRDSKARGIETYYLSFTTSQEALEVAARENAVSEKSVNELQDLVRKITLFEKVDESKEFAAEVQKALHAGMSRGNAGLRNRGVKKAPFVVLIGANMPSILAEISFVSNPFDERQLKKPEYRQRVAESLFRGIQRYANSLGGVRVASQTRMPE
jgi:N-acetylmuramoyl-L-alanine amidase